MIGWGWRARGAWVRVGLALSSVFLTAAAIVCPAGAAAQSVAGARAEMAARFWTTARMRQAKPLEVEAPGRPEIAFADPAWGPDEAPHVHPPPAPGAGATASSGFEAVPDPTTVDSRVNGVIFIKTPFGLGRCSGTSVNAPNYSVVFTAAHCIHTGGRSGFWIDFNSVFVPAYRYGQRPFGVFPVRWIDTTLQWRAGGSENFDIGASVVGRNERGQLLAKAVGGTGIAWGLKSAQVFDVHGYPAEEPFDGETQRICSQTPFLGHDAGSFLTAGPLNLAVDCDVTGGASGGGWTIRDGLLNSVTDYGYGDDSRTDFGAYFGKEAGRLYRRAGRVR
jgi:V8-like Glu-specific endopeptidase